MSTSEALQTFGNTFDVTYFNGSDYVTSTATYTGGTRSLIDDAGSIPAGVECLQYTAPCYNLSINPTYITLEMHPQYSIFNTTQIHTAVFVYSTTSAAVPPYQTPQWRWYVSGSEMLFEGDVDSNNNLEKATVNIDPCFYVNADITSQSTFSASSYRVTFIAPVTVSSDKLWFYIAPPYLSNDAYGSSGIITTATTSQNQGDMSGIASGIGETVDILEEHTGLLGDIIDFLHYIGECIAGDESEVSDVEPIETLPNPPDWDDAMSQVESALDDIPDMTASGGFIWALYNLIMSTSPVIKFLVPFGLIITLLSYIWWKK